METSPLRTSLKRCDLLILNLYLRLPHLPAQIARLGSTRVTGYKCKRLVLRSVFSLSGAASRTSDSVTSHPSDRSNTGIINSSTSESFETWLKDLETQFCNLELSMHILGLSSSYNPQTPVVFMLFRHGRQCTCSTTWACRRTSWEASRSSSSAAMSAWACSATNAATCASTAPRIASPRRAPHHSVMPATCSQVHGCTVCSLGTDFEATAPNAQPWQLRALDIPHSGCAS